MTHGGGWHVVVSPIDACRRGGATRCDENPPTKTIAITTARALETIVFIVAQVAGRRNDYLAAHAVVTPSVQARCRNVAASAGLTSGASSAQASAL